MSAINRRRFLQIGAALGCAGIASSVYKPRFTWSGKALGASAQITLYGDVDHIKDTMMRVRNRIAKIESEFSLFDENSSISRLNNSGQLLNPSVDMQRVMAASKNIHFSTFGAFDPGVQSKWQALAKGTNDQNIYPISDVHSGRSIQFKKSKMALTFNGIAQGYLSDEIHSLLKTQGYKDTLVNMGEFRAGDGRWLIELQNQFNQNLDVTNLHQMAMATSASDAMTIGKARTSHIFTSTHSPQWKTVTVKAKTAMIADAYSTAFILLQHDQILDIFSRQYDIKEIWLEGFDGQVKHHPQA